MPGVTQYIADPNSRTKAFRDQEDMVRSELRVRVQRIERNWAYYDGKHKKHLTEDGTNTDDNVIINLYGLVVEKGVSDLVGTTEQGVINGPKFEVADVPTKKPSLQLVNGRYSRPSPEKPEDQQWLDAALEANNKELFLHNMATTSGVGGHTFIKIIPDALPNPYDETRPLPRLVLLNPCHITVFWDEGDKDKILAYRIQYGKDRAAKRQEIVWETSDATVNEDGTTIPASAQWVIYDWEQRDNKLSWTLADVTPWDYTWPPIVQWQNLPDPNDFYGCEDVEDANRNLNDSLNFVASNIQRIIKYHADPKPVATGAKKDELLEQSVNSVMIIENEAAKVYNLEMQGDLKSSMDFAKMLRRAYFDGTRELDPATVEDRLGDLTNFGLRVLYGDKTKKTGTKRLMAGMGLTDICQRVLEIGKYGKQRKIAIHWPNVLPDDDIVETTALNADRANGLSQETYLLTRGYDVELEAKRRAQESAAGIEAAVTLRQGEKLDALRNGVNRNA